MLSALESLSKVTKALVTFTQELVVGPTPNPSPVGPKKTVSFAMDHPPVNTITSFFLIHRLPSEILQTIFRCCMPQGTPTYNPAKAPLLLCHVCANWRDVVTDMPELWTALRLSTRCMEPDNGNLCKRYMWAKSHWFANVKDKSLLAFEFYFHSRSHSFRGTRALVENLLLDCITQYRSLEVGAVNALDLLPFFTHSSGNLPNLESLVLRVPNLEAVGADKITVFQLVPRLRQVVLQTITLDLMEILPWAQLTHLTVTESLDHKDWLALLRGCCRLQHGIFSLSFPSCPEHYDYSPAQLDDLTGLDLAIDDEVHWSSLVPRWLSLPALVTLDVHSSLSHDEKPLFLIRSLSEHNHLAGVTKLLLDNLTVTLDLIDILGAMISLEDISIQLTTSTDNSDLDEKNATRMFPSDDFASTIASLWQKGSLRRVAFSTDETEILDKLHSLLKPWAIEGLLVELFLIDHSFSLPSGWSVSGLSGLTEEPETFSQRIH